MWCRGRTKHSKNTDVELVAVSRRLGLFQLAFRDARDKSWRPSRLQSSFTIITIKFMDFTFLAFYGLCNRA